MTRLDDVATGDSAMGGKQWRQCFTYDHLRRMTKAWSTSTTNCSAATSTTLGTIAPYSDVYTLSASGNRSKVVSMRKPSTSVTTTTRTSTFPAVTAARPHAVSSVASSGSATGTESFTYDAAGNMTKRSTSTTAGKVYEWDREGRVKSVADLATASKKIEYLYDADGNRLIERDNTGTTATITLNVGASQIKVNDGTTPALNTSTTRTYTIGDEAVATRTASGVRLMATDDQGTPLVTVNPNNLTYVKRRLSPFGEQLQAPASPGWPSNKGFLNKTTDTWAGTSHLEAREYDARDGRFISVDPIADFRDPQQLNGYGYANHAPVNRSDPGGMFATASDNSSYGPSSRVWKSAKDPRRPSSIEPSFVDGWGRPTGGRYIPTSGRAMGRKRDIFGALAANLTGSFDLALNGIQGRTPFSNGYKAYTTNYMAKKLGLDTDSFAFEATGAASLLVSIGSLGGSAGRTAAASSVGRVSDDASRVTAIAHQWTAKRAAELQSQLPDGARGRVSMGAGVLRDSQGKQVRVISTSEPRGYLRPGVSVRPGGLVARGAGHAEADIVSFAAENGYEVVSIGAGRPVCPPCAGKIAGSGGSPSTPLRR